MSSLSVVLGDVVSQVLLVRCGLMFSNATPRSHTVGCRQSRSDIIAHGRTWSNMIAQIFCSKTAVHGRTRSCTLVHRTAHGRIRTKLILTAHGRTKKSQLSEWPTLSSHNAGLYAAVSPGNNRRGNSINRMETEGTPSLVPSIRYLTS